MPALSVIIKGDASPFEKELRRTQALTNKFATSMGDGFVSGMATSMARGGGGKGMFGGRLGVAGSMFTSVARDSAASLASGAPITQIIAQQAPQVLQALTMMRLGMVALRFSMYGAAIGGVAYMANAWRKWFFEVDRTTALNGKIKEMIETTKKWHDFNRVSQSKDAENAVKEFDRNAERIKQINDIADAEANLEKERIKAHSLQTMTVRTAEEEKKVSEQQLAIDLKRAEAKLKELQSTKEYKAVLEAEASIKKIEAEGERTLAEDDAKIKAGISYGSKVTKEQHQQALREQLFHDLEYSEKYASAQKDLSLAKSKTNQAEITQAQATVLSLQNQLDELSTTKEQKLSSGAVSRRGSAPDVTDRQRMNLMAVGNSPLLDVNRQQLAYLKSIDQKMRRGSSIDAHFGSP